jgi:hypothetical protein
MILRAPSRCPARLVTQDDLQRPGDEEGQQAEKGGGPGGLIGGGGEIRVHATSNGVQMGRGNGERQVTRLAAGQGE